jgi:hypothetical protein
VQRKEGGISQVLYHFALRYIEIPYMIRSLFVPYINRVCHTYHFLIFVACDELDLCFPASPFALLSFCSSKPSQLTSK